MPAAINAPSSPRRRFGGAWIDIEEPKTSRAAAIGGLRHRRVGLGTEILDDELLNVTIPVLDRPQREQRLDDLAARLADADQEPGGKGHRELARGP
jgi:hypothetical protein